MIGDTLHLRFTTDATSTDWAYKFTVSGGKVGRFETGYMILNAVLSQHGGLRSVCGTLDAAAENEQMLSCIEHTVVVTCVDNKRSYFTV